MKYVEIKYFWTFLRKIEKDPLVWGAYRGPRGLLREKCRKYRILTIFEGTRGPLLPGFSGIFGGIGALWDLKDGLGQDPPIYGVPDLA